jgi:hypothetical protein
MAFYSIENQPLLTANGTTDSRLYLQIHSSDTLHGVLCHIRHVCISIKLLHRFRASKHGPISNSVLSILSTQSKLEEVTHYKPPLLHCYLHPPLTSLCCNNQDPPPEIFVNERSNNFSEILDSRT